MNAIGRDGRSHRRRRRYSDDSIGETAAIAAVALGATVLEKHFTLDHVRPGPDHHFSADPVQFTEYVQAVRRAEAMLGSFRKAPVAEEQAIRLAGRRFLIAVTDIPAGAVIEPHMLRPRRIDVSKAPDPALLLGPEAEQRALGFRTARAIPSGAVLDVGSVDFAAGRSPGR